LFKCGKRFRMLGLSYQDEPEFRLAVEQKVSQAMSNHDSALLEPWFQSQEIENEIKRRQTVTEQRKWTYYFEDWG
jgi:hypothetical protein